MKFTELLEGAKPQLPGAAGGIKIMTPQQFVAKSAADEEPEQGVAEEKDWSPGAKETINKDKIVSLKNLIAKYKEKGNTAKLRELQAELKSLQTVAEADKLQGTPVVSLKDFGDKDNKKNKYGQTVPKKLKKDDPRVKFHKDQKQGVAEGYDDRKTAPGWHSDSVKNPNFNDELSIRRISPPGKRLKSGKLSADERGSQERTKTLMKFKKAQGGLTGPKGVLPEQGVAEDLNTTEQKLLDMGRNKKYIYINGRQQHEAAKKLVAKGLAEKYDDVSYHAGGGEYYINPFTRKQGLTKGGTKVYGGTLYFKDNSVAEATKLPASTRELKGKELEDYLDRIRGQEKEKTDKYKLPYIHRSSVISYYSAEGKKYDIDAIKSALGQRPEKLLKKNEKMKHSDGTDEQFFNIGFAALVGIALDQETNELIVVNTCPGAGSCKVDCFAMKGGKIQFQGPWLSDGRILTYLLNDPDGFFSQLKSEIQKEEAKGKKGGYKVSIRWHDAGDFFSPEYAEMAFKLARELPNIGFYAYTKVADVALGDKPDNFMINWSEGAHTSQEKKVKAADPGLERTKNSRIVPTNLFYDLLVKDEKKNLVKGSEGQWQVIPDKLPELKSRLAKQYNLAPSSILSYSEWENKGRKIPNMKWNVIITPGEPDLTAKDPGVLSTLLLKH